jgi:hypothetical protein
MTETASRPPSQADGSGSIAVASWNIRNGRSGGFESALQAMEAMGIDIGILLETKVTGGIYTCFSSGYSVVASNAASGHQGGIALFWRPNKSYVVEDWCVRGPNVLSFVIVTGGQRFYARGYYIPLNDLSTLTTINQAWNGCPLGHTPILLGNPKVNLHAPWDDRDKQIAKAVEDVMGLCNLFTHFLQQSRGLTVGNFVAFVCERRIITTQIIVQLSPKFAWGVQQRWRPTRKEWPISQSNSPLALKSSVALCLRSFDSTSWRRPYEHNHATLGSRPPHGRRPIKGQRFDSRGSCHSKCLVSSGDRSKQGCQATGGSMQRLSRRTSKCTWRAGR